MAERLFLYGQENIVDLDNEAKLNSPRDNGDQQFLSIHYFSNHQAKKDPVLEELREQYSKCLDDQTDSTGVSPDASDLQSAVESHKEAANYHICLLIEGEVLFSQLDSLLPKTQQVLRRYLDFRFSEAAVEQALKHDQFLLRLRGDLRAVESDGIIKAVWSEVLNSIYKDFLLVTGINANLNSKKYIERDSINFMMFNVFFDRNPILFNFDNEKIGEIKLQKKLFAKVESRLPD